MRIFFQGLFHFPALNPRYIIFAHTESFKIIFRLPVWGCFIICALPWDCTLYIDKVLINCPFTEEAQQMQANEKAFKPFMHFGQPVLDNSYS